MRDGRATAGPDLPRSFLTWSVAASVSDVGGNAMYFALLWAATAHGGAAAGLVVGAITAPRTILLLIGGAVADRTGPRGVMMAGDASLLVTSAALAVTAWAVGTPLWLLVAGALAVGVVSAFYLPASSSMPRRLVPDELVPRALALRQTGLQLAQLSGGPLGGVLVVAVGFAAAAGVNAISFVPVLLVMVLSRRLHPAPAVQHQSLARDVASGVAVAWSVPLLRIGLLLVAAAVAVVIPTGSILIPLLVRSHGSGAGLAGLTLGAQSVGGITVGVTVARRGTATYAGRTAALGLACTAAGLLLLASAPSSAATVCGGGITGAGTVLFTSHALPLIMTGTPRDHLSRVQSLVSLVQAATLVVAGPVIGLSAERVGIVTTLMAETAVLTGAALAAILVPTWRHATTASIHRSQDQAS